MMRWRLGGRRSRAAGSRNQRSPVVVAAAAAAVTRRIRLGFSFLLPALHDPVRLAGDIATLDMLSGGRETVARRVAELRDELGVQYVNLRPSIGGNCPPALQAVTVELFATEIMPRLAAPDSPAASRA
jgi:hypothetical protein